MHTLRKQLVNDLNWKELSKLVLSNAISDYMTNPDKLKSFYFTFVTKYYCQGCTDGISAPQSEIEAPEVFENLNCATRPTKKNNPKSWFRDRGLGPQVQDYRFFSSWIETEIGISNFGFETGLEIKILVSRPTYIADFFFEIR